MRRLTTTGRLLVAVLTAIAPLAATCAAVELDLRVQPQDRRLPAFVLRLHSHEYGTEEPIPWEREE